MSLQAWSLAKHKEWLLKIQKCSGRDVLMLLLDMKFHWELTYVMLKCANTLKDVSLIEFFFYITHKLAVS